jgi:superfamily II RNA helicase
MAGRAGRRGIDTVGHVVHCNNLFPLPSINDYKTILCGKPQKLVSKFHISYSTVLNLLKNERSTFTEFTDFVGKSMLANELERNKTSAQSVIDQLKESLEKKERLLELARTPTEDIKKVDELSSIVHLMPNKKRKETEREIQQIKENHKWFEQDYAKYKECLDIKKELTKEIQVLDYSEQYISSNIHKICTLLENEKVIERTEETSFGLLTKGKIACNLAEIPSVIGAIITVEWNFFNEFTVKQLIGLFSCFTDIKVPEDNRRLAPHSKDAFLKTKIQEVSKVVLYFEKEEMNVGLDTGIQYYDLLCYDIVDEIQEWTECETEEQCKYFIQTQIYQKEISIGEFTKAVLKIATIVKEFMNVAEEMGEVEMLFKMTQIEPLILKYITTAQSLYI